MAPANGRKNSGLSELLLREPYRFDFFQAVRLVEWLMHERAGEDPAGQRFPVGQDRLPEREVVRFRALPALSFPPSAITQLRQPPQRPGPDALPPPLEMVVSFMGLTGPNGVLPYHYTSQLLRRLRDKDYSLRDFLDLFNHRLVSLFYRAWEKYRLPFSYERSRLPGSDGAMDLCTRGLYSFVGLGTEGLRGRLEVNDEAFLFYAGHFAHYPRSAIALECLLAEHFGMPIRVLQLQGQWLTLDPDDRALMPCPEFRLGRNNQLGTNLVVGERIWDVQSKFRLRVGPLSYAQFRRLLPTGDRLRPLCQMTTAYVGPDLDFDVQLVLAGKEVPWCRLGDNGDNGAFLGLNTWVRCQDFSYDVDDTVFFLADA